MINQPRLIIGEEDLTQYLGPEPRRDQARIEEMSTELKRNIFNTLSIEKNYFEDLTRRLTQECYPLLDVSFFQEPIETSLKDFRLKVPRFNIYPVAGKNCFSYTLEHRHHGPFTPYDLILTFKTEPDLTTHLASPLLKSTDLVENPRGYRANYIYSDKPKAIIKGVVEGVKRSGIIARCLYLNTFLNARVPDVTREEIAKAKKIFGDSMGFVAERKPSDWKGNPEIITTTPLAVVGFDSEHKCYLISNFNLPKSQTAQLNQEPNAE